MSDADAAGTGVTSPDPMTAITSQISDLVARMVSLERAPWNDAIGVGGVLTTGDVVGGFGSSRAGCLLMDSSVITDAEWPALCAFIRANLPALVIDGSSVHLPEGRGNALVGADGATFVLGTPVGVETVTLTGAQSGLPGHAHTMAATTGSTTPGNTGATAPATDSQGAHTHNTAADVVHNLGSGGNLGSAGTYNQGATATNSAGAHTHTVASHTHTSAAHTHTLPDTDAVAAANAAQAHTNVQPSLPVNLFIKT